MGDGAGARAGEGGAGGVGAPGPESRPAWRVTPIDPTDDEQFASWFAVVEATHEPLWPGAQGWQPPELRACMILEDAPERSLPLAVRDGDGAGDGSVVGAGLLDMQRDDNTHLAMASVYVHPQHRRRGVGSALLAALERLAIAEGCTTVAGWQDEPVAQRGDSPGRHFAEHHGFRMVQLNPRRDLEVPIDAARRAALDEECARFAAGYRTESFSGPWPEEYLAERAEFGYRMSTDTPRGEFDREDEVWDEARVRRAEAVIEAANRVHVCAVVVHEASGRLAGFTEIAVPRGSPFLAWQHDTLILREHRGHRLGTLVKLANLDELARSSPATRIVATHNAVDNDPMITVNDALGCVVTADGLTWQKRVA